MQKIAAIFVLALTTTSCLKEIQDTSGPLVVIPDTEWKQDEVYYDRSQSLWRTIQDSSEVSGRITFYFNEHAMAKEIPVFNGKKEGVQRTYFPNGQLKFEESYSNNKLHGKVRRWGIEEGHQLLAELNYEDGKLHGKQRKWYPSGELHKLLNLVAGKEDGMQKAFRKNGALYANYEAKNGRVFGLKRANLCYELENEQVVYFQ